MITRPKNIFLDYFQRHKEWDAIAYSSVTKEIPRHNLLLGNDPLHRSNRGPKY